MRASGVLLVLLVAAAQGLQPPRLVYPRLLQERSVNGKMVLHLHDDLTLNLEGASVAASRMRVLTHEDGLPLTQFYDGESINRNLYEDAEKMATVSLKAWGKSVELVGIVGPNHRIEPLPTAERSDSGLIPHLIHEIESKEMRDKVLTLNEEDAHTNVLPRADWSSSRVPPAEVIIEVFIVADRPHPNHFNKTEEMLIYFCVTLNSANLRFQDMTRPKVRLMLTGAERNSDETFLRVDSQYTHDSQTLKAFKDYAYEKKATFGHPDVVFFFTGRDVVTDTDEGTISTNGLGIAYLGGLCTESYVGLGEDRPGLFTGMFTFSHEMGHLLGSQHDGSAMVPLVPGYVGSEECPWDDGFMMSYKDKGANHQRFSECSLKQMSLVILYRGKKCWIVLSTGEEYVDRYPGNMVTPEQVCRNVFPDQNKVSAEMVFPKGSECKLKCKYQVESEEYIHTYSRKVSAPDYTACGHNMVCVRGLCVYDRRRKGNRPQKTRSIEGTTTPKPTSTTKRQWRWPWNWNWWHNGKK